jgi:hypothetical protein
MRHLYLPRVTLTLTLTGLKTLIDSPVQYLRTESQHQRAMLMRVPRQHSDHHKEMPQRLSADCCSMSTGMRSAQTEWGVACAAHTPTPQNWPSMAPTPTDKAAFGRKAGHKLTQTDASAVQRQDDPPPFPTKPNCTPTPTHQDNHVHRDAVRTD